GDQMRWISVLLRRKWLSSNDSRPGTGTVTVVIDRERRVVEIKLRSRKGCSRADLEMRDVERSGIVASGRKTIAKGSRAEIHMSPWPPWPLKSVMWSEPSPLARNCVVELVGLEPTTRVL